MARNSETPGHRGHFDTKSKSFKMNQYQNEDDAFCYNIKSYRQGNQNPMRNEEEENKGGKPIVINNNNNSYYISLHVNDQKRLMDY